MTPKRTPEELAAILDDLDAIEMQGQSEQAWRGLSAVQWLLEELIKEARE